MLSVILLLANFVVINLLLAIVILINLCFCLLQGEFTLTFGKLLRKLWSQDSKPVAPKMFKLKLDEFTSQFRGYDQHDSQVIAVT